MSTEIPIACSLNAGELTHRFAEISNLGREALLDAEPTELGATLRFTPEPGVQARLARIVAAESECCGFLTMAVRSESDAVVLTIAAPEGAEPVVRDLLDAFRGDKAESA